MPTPCGPGISEASSGELSHGEADALAARMHRMAQARAAASKVPLDDALRGIAGEIRNSEEAMPEIQRRNVLLNTRAKRAVKDFASRFKTIGEGVLAYLEGSSRLIPGARSSVDYQAKSLHGKYFGKFIADLEAEDLLSTFRRNSHEREIYQEMGEIGKPGGKPGISGSKEAQWIAEIIDKTTEDMVSRQNRAGAFITRKPGYVMRQTHDVSVIRKLGGPGNDLEAVSQSYEAWNAFTRPLLDPEKTYEGWDPDLLMRKVHQALYTGVHGPDMPDAEVSLFNLRQDIGSKASQRRVLHFKDAESAYLYNQKFGSKNLRDQVFGDLHFRSRNIALMEALGPNPEMTFQQALMELRKEARDRGDVAGIDSLNTWKLQAALDTVSGKADTPVNPTLAGIMRGVKAAVSMAKMGGIILVKSFNDKAFLQAEMAHQGISNLETLSKQLTGMAVRTGEERRALRLMGVAMDGLIGNTVARYTMHDQVAGWTHRAQQKFFDLNFLNYWTEVHKASAAELMASHLGEHADLPMDPPRGGGEVLPTELKNVLSLYDITPSRWDAIRSTARDVGNGRMTITPDQLVNVPDEVIGKLITDSGRRASDANVLRERDALETSLRTYLMDRVDMAVPTPGAKERRWMTLGTRSGTPLGEAVRLLTLFKSFPLTITSKILARDVYGRGNDTIRQFIMSDHAGKFHLASLIAMATASGYLALALKDALNGKEPEPLIVDGQVNLAALSKAAVRGGGMGLFGDVVMNDFDEEKRNFLQFAAGPVLGQSGTLMSAITKAREGENFSREAQKLVLDNTPLINLVYVRPVLNYLVLWNLQEMLSPGSLGRTERGTEQRNHQDYFLKPSEVVEQ